MVLINSLTIDEINAALLHLQRSKDEVVGGVKGDTVQNVTINNKGGGSTADYAPTIELLSERIDKNAEDIEDVDKEIDKIKNALEGLVSNGIVSLTFDNITRNLTLYTEENEYTVTITSDAVTLSFDDTTNKLTLTYGEDSYTVTLPYINASEKGSANGVATLDSSGRVPYSQLPESAMEFLGNWDASTNTPHLQDGTGTNGDFYVCNVGGTVTFGTGNTQTFVPNDRVIYNGASSQWIKLPAGQVSSVNGMSGDVTLTASDINYSTGVSIKAKIDANAVQSDWNVSDTTSLAYIKNKPSLATVATSGSYTDLSNKPTIPAAQIQSNWTQTDTTKKDYIKNKPTLATVATSGNYNDLSNKPTIPAAQVQSDWNVTNTSSKAFIKNKPTLATVATSGSYTDLSNKPTIPAAQIQSDWTQTDSTQKDFIKNKIPIWITNGSADDNMSPVDVVEAGNTRPVTSGGVANALAIPKDAVLHYSFDEVPDYPDGTSVYKKLKFETANEWSVFQGTKSIQDNKLKLVSNGSNAYFNILNNSLTSSLLTNKIIIIRVEADNLISVVLQDNGGSYTLHTLQKIKVSSNEYIFMGVIPTVSYNQLITFSFNSASVNNIALVEAIYIGAGSYNTPVIDNANGQNNATNNGGIAVQGVSGKGVRFLGNGYIDGNLPWTPWDKQIFSLSCWIRNWDKSTNLYLINNWITFAISTLHITFNPSSENKIIIDVRIGSDLYRFNNTTFDFTQLEGNIFVACILNGTSTKLYMNGVSIPLLNFKVDSWAESTKNRQNFQIGRRRESSGYAYSKADIDDFQIFDRALSEQEVQALYLNKGNTPKYYSWADWKLSQM